MELNPAADQVPSRCAVLLDGILTIPQARLQRRITTLTPQRMAEVFAAIRFAFQMT